MSNENEIEEKSKSLTDTELAINTTGAITRLSLGESISAFDLCCLAEMQLRWWLNRKKGDNEQNPTTA